ncbi:Uncharacterised protein [Vibrio cholerae]|nr:Uncharacterised protein [Vibrio cholerae]
MKSHNVRRSSVTPSSMRIEKSPSPNSEGQRLVVWSVVWIEGISLLLD